MPSWKRVIVSGSDAALNSLNVTTSLTASGLIYPTTDGVSDQVLKTDGNGNLFFEYTDDTTISIKNVSGGTIVKGTPCYITASGTSGNVAGVVPADAGNPLRMPAGVIAGVTLNNGDEGPGLLNGFINGVDTSAFAAGDQVYVAVGGGYTNVAPTGSALVQKLGNVEKVDASNGSGVINGPNATRSVPNINPGYLWVGNSDWVATAVATSSIQNVVSSSYATTSSLAITAQKVAIPLSSGYTGLLEANGSWFRLRHSNSGTHIDMSSGNTTSFGQVGYHTNGLNVTPGGNSTSYGLIVTSGSYPAATIFRAGVNDIAVTGSKVGIGKTNPTSKLDVNGNTNITGSLAVTGSVSINNSTYSNQTNTVDAETKTIISIYSAGAIHMDYYVTDGSSVRAGTFVGTWDGGGSREFYETATNDIGDTTDVVFTVTLPGSQMDIDCTTTTTGWTVVTNTRTLTV